MANNGTITWHTAIVIIFLTIMSEWWLNVGVLTVTAVAATVKIGFKVIEHM